MESVAARQIPGQPALFPVTDRRTPTARRESVMSAAEVLALKRQAEALQVRLEARQRELQNLMSAIQRMQASQSRPPARGWQRARYRFQGWVVGLLGQGMGYPWRFVLRVVVVLQACMAALVPVALSASPTLSGERRSTLAPAPVPVRLHGWRKDGDTGGVFVSGVPPSMRVAYPVAHLVYYHTLRGGGVMTCLLAAGLWVWRLL